MSFHKKDKDFFWDKLSKRKKVFSLVIILILIFIGLFYGLIKPSIIGYVTYKNMQDYDVDSISQYMRDIDDLDSALTLANANISFYSQFNDKLFDNLGVVIQDIKDCESDLSQQKVLLEKLDIESAEEIEELEQELEDETEELEQELEEKEKEINDLKQSNADTIKEIEKENTKTISDLKSYYDSLISNLANNKCCKEKVDNSLINSYIIENNNVLCLVEGTFNLEC